MDPKFSSRLPWSAAPNALSLAIDRRTSNAKPILDLTQSNPTAAGIVYPNLSEAFAGECWLRYEPTACGLLQAREAVSEYYGDAVEPSRILLTASTSEAYAYLFKLLCDPGDQVLVPRPSYPLFDMLAQLECVRAVPYPLHYDDGWFVDIRALAEAVTDRTRALLWVNPNNPTGSYLKHSEYQEIADLCLSRGLGLVSDEVFADYPLQFHADAIPTLTSLGGCLTFCLSGLSKISALPQMKLGWIAAGGPGHQRALEKLEWIADTFLSVNAPVQCAASTLLQARHSVQKQIRTRVSANLRYLEAKLAGSPCSVLRIEGGWYATLQVPSVRPEEVWTLELLDRGVLVQPGFFYDFDSEAFLVISLLTEPHVFEPGIQHILEAC